MKKSAIRIIPFEGAKINPSLVLEYLRDTYPRSLLILGDITKPMREYTNLWLYLDGEEVHGVAAQFYGFKHIVLAVVAEEEEAVRHIILQLNGDKRTTVLAVNEMVPIPEDIAILPGDYDLWMVGETTSHNPRGQVVKLDNKEELNDFYTLTKMNYWSPPMLDFGHFFGIRENSKLVSTAGVNFVLQEQNYAQIGCVVTIPELRGKRFATSCLLATIDSLYRAGINLCGLFADRDDKPLTQFYMKMGFQESGLFRFIKI